MFNTRCEARTLPSRLAVVAAGLFVFAASTFAQTQSEAIIPNRITQPINPDVRVSLSHNVHPLALPKYDQGLAPGSMETGRIMLVLKRSAAQEQSLRQYLGDLQNPNSPNYRQWLTPAQFGKLYGISDIDLITVTAWLQSQGFTIDKVPQARNVIIFSGNVAQIRQAFSTSIHKYFVNGETYFANSADPQIPAALAPVIAGIAPLNDFHPKRQANIKTAAHFDTETKRIKPDLTVTSSGSPYLFTAPADAATIYDLPNNSLNYPKYTGNTYDGTGVTIGIAGDSNINAQDVQLYRAALLPSLYSGNNPYITIDGNDPGINGDAIEALLDLEVSGGIAPSARINFYTSANTDLQAGLILAIDRALDDNVVSILNVSFGACELAQGNSGNAQILSMWQQAAAQGISVTVSTGDSGSAGCDNPSSETAAQHGLAVNGLASTAYNIAVGGTDFDILGTSFSNYVSTSNASNYYRTALSYIPENPWNDSTSTNAGGYSSNQPLKDPNGNTNIFGGGGGSSSCVTQTGNGSCTAGYSTPPFQTGLSGFPYSTRTLPDVSFLAGDGLYGALWLVCSDNVANGSDIPQTDCQTTNGTFTNSTTFTGVGGTSAATPAFAGMLALVSQSQGGARLGQAANVLYNLAAQGGLYSTIFHDVTVGNNSVFCAPGSPNCGSNDFLTGYNAGTGYDAASGLGSVDAVQMIANWTKATFFKTNTTLQITGFSSATTATHGTPLTFSSTVTSTGGSTPTGGVSFINNSGVENGGSIGSVQLNSSGQVSSATSSDLPGGSYYVYAYYGGDVKNAPSESTPIPVFINPENSQLAIGAYIHEPIHGTVLCNDLPQNGPIQPCNGVTAPYGYVTFISTQIQGASGSTSGATGDIALSDSAGPLTYYTGGSFTSSSPIYLPISSNGIASYNNNAFQQQSLSVATHGLTAAYPGDTSYIASNSASSFPIKVAQGNTTVAVSGSQSGATVTLQAQVNTDSIGVAPTGTVTFAVGSTTLGTAPTAQATGFVSNGSNNGSTVASLYSISIPASTNGLVNGNNTITASYAGDTNYAKASGSATVVVSSGSGGGSFSLSGSAITISAGATSGNTTTINVTPSASGFTGTVSLTCAVTGSPTGATNLPTCSMNPTSVTLSGTAVKTSTLAVSTVSTTTPGSYIISATGANRSSFTSSTSIPLTVTGSTIGAQGAYFGSASNGETFEAIILPNNKLYALYGTTSGNIFNIRGMITGQGSSSNGTYSASITDYYYDGTTYTGSVSASYVPGASINGTIIDSGVGTLSFTGSALPTSQYNYNAPASLSTIAGTWNGALFGGVGASVSISSNGTFTGSSQGCSYSGSISPGASGMNFFDFSLTYGSSPCLLPNQTQTGIAVDYLLSDGVTRQLLAGLSSGSSGNVFVANSTGGSVSATYSLSATSVTVAPGSPGTSTVTVSSTSGYAGTIILSCTLTSSPTGAENLPTCVGNPTVNLSSSAGSGVATLTLNTTGATSAMVLPPPVSGKRWSGAGSGPVFAIVILLWVPKRRNTWRSILGIALAITIIGGMTACGGGGSSNGVGSGPSKTNSGTSAGTYTFTVSGTGNDSARTTVSTTFILTVN